MAVKKEESTLLENLVNNGIKVVSYVRETGNLEEVFMMVTAKKEVLS